MKLDEANKRLKELRDQLGKSELEKQRQASEFQAELTTSAKRQRAIRSQNDQLARKLQEAQKSHAVQPPPAPPALHQRSVGMSMFG